MSTPRTIVEKIWDAHIVSEREGAPALLYIDLQLVHEVTSPQAFDGLRARGLKVRRPDRTFGTVDHSTPTLTRLLPHCRSDCGDAGGPAGGELHGVRHPALRFPGPQPGRGARHRPRERPDAAGHDRGVRRQPHGDARGFRCTGVRHRHQRSRDGAGLAMPAATPVPELSRCRWTARWGRAFRPRTLFWR